MSDDKFLTYDPHIFGYSANFFYAVGGTVNIATGGKIRVSGGSAYSKVLSLHGNTTMKLTVPTAPTAGDSRIFGFYSWVHGNKNAAYFFISGTNFYVRSYDEDGTVEQTTVTWLAAWTNAATNYEIRKRIDKVEFYINGAKVAAHFTYIPRQNLMPMYWSNSNSDSLYIDLIEIVNARKLDFSLTTLFNSTNTGSTSHSPSPSYSPSISPSISPSVSPSASYSPSSSPSASYSPSISPSSSPSASYSPSVSPSSSSSASYSPSISPSSSQSASYSPSSSASSSASASPSTAQ